MVILSLSDLSDVPIIFEGTAAAIWRAIDDVRDVDAIGRILTEQFEAPPGSIDHDVAVFLARAVELSLLEPFATPDKITE